MYTFVMSSKLSRISLVPPPPPERRVFKIKKCDNGIMITIPKKEGRFMASPSYVYDLDAKE